MSDLETKNSAPPVRIRVDVSATVMVAQYEPVRVGVSVEDSARPSEKAQELFDRLYAFVENNVTNKVEELKNG